MRWTSLRRAASEVTSTLTAAAHPRLSSKRPRHRAAQETATLQPAPGKPDGGTQRTVPRTLGTLPRPLSGLRGWRELTREVTHPIAPQAERPVPCSGVPTQRGERGEIQPRQAAASALVLRLGRRPF